MDYTYPFSLFFSPNTRAVNLVWTTRNKTYTEYDDLPVAKRVAAKKAKAKPRKSTNPTNDTHATTPNPPFLAPLGEILNRIYEPTLTTQHKPLSFLQGTTNHNSVQKAPRFQPAQKNVYRKLHNETADLVLRYNSIRANYPQDPDTPSSHSAQQSKRAWINFSTAVQSTRRHDTLARKTLHQLDQSGRSSLYRGGQPSPCTETCLYFLLADLAIQICSARHPDPLE
jgi:hypothetical protein